MGVSGLSIPLRCSVASASSASLTKADSISRESPLEKGIHFFGLGSGFSGWMAVDAKGLRLGSYKQDVSVILWRRLERCGLI